MFKFFVFCFFSVVAFASAKPGIVAPLAYSSPLVAAPYTTAYTAAYTAPYAAAYSYPYASSYVAAPFAAYSAYPYAASYVLRK